MPLRTCYQPCGRGLLLRSLLAAAAVLALPSFAGAADAVPAVLSSPTPSSSPDPSLAVNGYLSTRYVYRSASSAERNVSDQDLFADLRFDISRPKDNRYEFHFLGSGRSDLDGTQDRTVFNPLEDVADTYGTRASGEVFEANAVLNGPVEHITRLRIGRQSGTRDEPVVFDGASMDLGSEKVNLTLYGGAAMHFYEVGRHWGRDTFEGAGIDYLPFPSTGLSADFLAVKDRREFTPDDATIYDRLVSLKVWQVFEPYARVAAKYRFLDGGPRDLALSASNVWPEGGLDAVASYFRQFRPQQELTTDLSLFYDVMGVSAPYQSFDVKVRKFFAERVALDAGYFKRMLLDPGGEGTFDKEFWRAFLDVEVTDLFLENLSGTVLVEQWKSRGRAYDAAGADVSYKMKKNNREARISVGTNYSLYKYDDYLQLGLREQVRTWYVNGKYPLDRGFSVNGAYEYEHSSENYQVLRVGVRYDF